MKKENIKPLVTVILSAVIFFGILQLVLNYGYQLLNLTYESASDIRSAKAVLMQIFVDAAAIAIAFAFYKISNKSFTKIGFTLNKKNSILTLILFFIIVVEYTALIIITSKTDAATWQIADSISIRYIIQALIVFLMVGAGEEILFRGYIFKTLLTYNKATAYILSSLLFTLPHFIGSSFNIGRFITLIVLSLFFAYIYDKTGSIIPGIIVHMSMDFIGFLVIKNQPISVFRYTGSIQALNYLSVIAILLQVGVIYYFTKNITKNNGQLR